MDAFSFFIGIWAGIAIVAAAEMIRSELRYRRERRDAIPDDLRDAFYSDDNADVWTNVRVDRADEQRR